MKPTYETADKLRKLESNTQRIEFIRTALYVVHYDSPTGKLSVWESVEPDDHCDKLGVASCRRDSNGNDYVGPAGSRGHQRYATLRA